MSFNFLKIISDRQVSILFKSIKNKRDYAMFMLMLRCGLRLEEVVNLSLPSIDFESSTILVLRGKFRKDRIVYMGEEARNALLDYLILRKPDSAYTCDFSHCVLLFLLLKKQDVNDQTITSYLTVLFVVYFLVIFSTYLQIIQHGINILLSAKHHTCLSA